MTIPRGDRESVSSRLRRWVLRCGGLLGAGAWLALASAAWAQTPDPESTPLVGAVALPRDLSPWGMFVSADVVVKAVIVGLTFASVVTWTVWLAKTLELFFARRAARAALAILAAARSLAEVEPAGAASPGAELRAAALAELRLSADALDKEGLKERIASRLER